MNRPLIQRKRYAVLGIVACLLLPSSARGGAWTLPAGRLWCKLTAMRQSTDEEYVAVGGSGRMPDPGIAYEAGDRARYRLDGRYDSYAVFLDLAYGLTDRIDVGLQVPFFRQQYRDSALLAGFGEPRTATGFSDIRAVLKARLLEAPLVASIRAGLKAPTGDFRNEDGLVPVGEGQWDLDVVLQIGRSFWPVRAYAGLAFGRRFRARNDGIDRDPGDEWLALAEAGYRPYPALLLTLKVEAIRGEPATSLGIRTVQDVKRVTYISPGLTLARFGSLAVEGSVRFTVNGRNYPAGHVYLLGIAYQADLYRRP
jgi:hypothetical protein